MRNVILILAGSLLLQAARAQEKRQDPIQITDSSTDGRETRTRNLSEVTLSATRFSENKKFLAQQVFGIGSRQIENANQPTTADLLSQSGQVLVQKSQLGGGSPVIRGFEANKVLIAVDGIRMNNAIYRGGHLQNVISMDNESMERVELLFGPSSVMYGSDALGGVMSFYTRNPEITKEKTISAGASARYASACDEMHVHADLKTGSARFATYSSITFTRFGDLRQGKRKYDAFPLWGNDSFNIETINGADTLIRNPHPEKQSPTGYDQYDAVQKFLFYSGTVRHLVNLQFSTTNDIPRYDRLSEVGSTGLHKNAEWYYGPQQRFLAAWQLDLKKSAWFDQARIIPSFQDILESRHNRSFGSTSLKNRNEHVKVISLNADFTKKGIKSEWTYGAEWNHNDVDSRANAEDIITGSSQPLDTRYPDGGSRTMQGALYASLIHKLNTHWVLNAGTRLSISSLISKFDDTAFFPFPYREIRQKSRAVTGNIGIIWLPGHDWKYSVLISSGFRTPNVDDLTKIFESNAGNLIVPNPELKPEQTINYEAGITKVWNGSWQATVTGWYTDYKNILTSDTGTFNGQSVVVYDGVPSRVMTTVNKSKARLYGASLNLEGDLNKRFYFRSSVNYTRGRIREAAGDYPLDHISPLFGKIAVGYRTKSFTGEIFTLFNGKKDSSDYNLRGEDNALYSADPVRGFTPAWTTWNVKMTLKINELISIQCAVENILDRYYRVFSSGISGPGRNFTFTMRAKLPQGRVH